MFSIKLKSDTVIAACGIPPEASCYAIYCAAVQFCLENDQYLKTGNEQIFCSQLAERYEDLLDLRKNKKEKFSYYIKKQLTGGMKTSWAFYLRRQRKNIPPLPFSMLEFLERLTNAVWCHSEKEVLETVWRIQTVPTADCCKIELYTGEQGGLSDMDLSEIVQKQGWGNLISSEKDYIFPGVWKIKASNGCGIVMQENTARATISNLAVRYAEQERNPQKDDKLAQFLFFPEPKLNHIAEYELLKRNPVRYQNQLVYDKQEETLLWHQGYICLYFQHYFPEYKALDGFPPIGSQCIDSLQTDNLEQTGVRGVYFYLMQGKVYFVVAESVFEECCSKLAKKYGRWEHKPENIYLYFTLADAAIPFFELIQKYPELENVLISLESLLAVLWAFHKDYLLNYQVQYSGRFKKVFQAFLNEEGEILPPREIPEVYLRVKWLLPMNIDHISMCQYDILCSLNAGEALSTLQQKYDMSEEDITVLYLWGCMKIYTSVERVLLSCTNKADKGLTALVQAVSICILFPDKVEQLSRVYEILAYVDTIMHNSFHGKIKSRIAKLYRQKSLNYSILSRLLESPLCEIPTEEEFIKKVSQYISYYMQNSITRKSFVNEELYRQEMTLTQKKLSYLSAFLPIDSDASAIVKQYFEKGQPTYWEDYDIVASIFDEE